MTVKAENKCTKCTHNLEYGSKFCHHCCEKVTIKWNWKVCSECEEKIPFHAKYCDLCGYQQSKMMIPKAVLIVAK